MEFLYGQIIALHWRKKTLDSYRQGHLLQQLDSLQTGAEFTYDLAGNRTRIQTSVSFSVAAWGVILIHKRLRKENLAYE